MIDGEDDQSVALALTSRFTDKAFEWLTGCIDQNEETWDPPEDVISEVKTGSLRS
jgi:hypothetical protein